MSAEPQSKRIQRLKDRSAMLRSVRDFFYQQGVTEVDTPLLSKYPPIDPHIQILTVQADQERYLHTSPEYAMKRLLSEGIGDIFQLGHVYRGGEVGTRHNPEFSMLEWYRVAWTLEQLQEEVAQIVELFVGPQKREHYSYDQVFKKYFDWRASEPSEEELRNWVKQEGIDPAGMDRDDLLNTLFGLRIEPHLGQEGIVIIHDYPASQAELAKVREREGQTVAERFEVYFKGYELANGYGELLDADEQLRRFEERNRKRAGLGKTVYAIDPRFIEALRLGVPDCVGVAVGFDRLMMLRHSEEQIREILPFGWDKA